MDKHKEDVKKLANPILDSYVKRSIILKPGGGGFLRWCHHTKSKLLGWK